MYRHLTDEELIDRAFLDPNMPGLVSALSERLASSIGQCADLREERDDIAYELGELKETIGAAEKQVAEKRANAVLAV
jgi:hypothetical protein